jgi:hypothetical protein
VRIHEPEPAVPQLGWSFGFVIEQVPARRG